MPDIPVNKVAEILKKYEEIDPVTLRRIVEEMNLAVQPDDDSPERETVKKQFSIVICEPDGEDADITGWVFQIPEDASVTSTCDRVHKAAYEFNTTKRGRMMPAKSFADAVENIPAKHFKEQQVWVKTKAPVFVLTTTNEIPTERAE